MSSITPVVIEPSNHNETDQQISASLAPRHKASVIIEPPQTNQIPFSALTATPETTKENQISASPIFVPNIQTNVATPTSTIQNFAKVDLIDFSVVTETPAVASTTPKIDVATPTVNESDANSKTLNDLLPGTPTPMPTESTSEHERVTYASSQPIPIGYSRSVSGPESRTRSVSPPSSAYCSQSSGIAYAGPTHGKPIQETASVPALGGPCSGASYTSTSPTSPTYARPYQGSSYASAY